MTDTLIEQIKADAEKGAKGSWSLSDCSNFDGRATYRYYEVMDENLNVICAEVYRAHNDGGSHNMRRICRVPEYEARILADAEEKAAMRQSLKNVLERLEASLFTNAEHAQAMEFARAALTSIGDSDE